MSKYIIYLIFIATGYSAFSQQDSLIGFDSISIDKLINLYNPTNEEMINLNRITKREYINNKYGLNKTNLLPINLNEISRTNLPSNNLNFESGNFSGWNYSWGNNLNSLEIDDASFPNNTFPNIAIITASTDPIVGLSTTSPLGGNFVARINNTITGQYQVKIRNVINVTQNDNLLKFAYAAVIKKCGHYCNQIPYFGVNLRDTLGNVLFRFQTNPKDTVTNINGCKGINQTNYIDFGGTTGCHYSNWQTKCVDLTPYLGTNVIIEVIAAACTLGAHWGYGYFDAKLETCPDYGSPNYLQIANQLINLNSNYIQFYNSTCTQTVNAIAPTWPNYYNWNGSPGSEIYSLNTNSIVVEKNGLYTLSMGSNSVCPLTKTMYFKANDIPNVSLTAQGPFCVNSPFTISLNGAQTYSWSNGDIGPKTAIYPTTIGIHSISVVCTSSIGCSTTKTYTFNVNGLPTVFVTGTSTTCNTSSVNLQGNGAVNYSWLSVFGTNTFVTFTPTISATIPTNTISMTGTDNNGCQSSVVHTMTFSPIISLNAGISATSVCSGGTINLFSPGPQQTIPFPATYTLENGVSSYTVPGWTNFPITPTSSAIYTLTAFNYCGYLTNTFAINVQTLTPNLTFTTLPPFCKSSYSIALNGADNYSLSGSFSSYSVNNNIMTIANPGNSLTVIGTFSNSLCKAQQTLNPIAFTPSFNLLPMSPVCISNVSTLNPTGGTGNYTITPLGIFNNNYYPTSSTFTANSTFTTVPPNGTMFYSIDGQDGNGCIGSNTITMSAEMPTVAIKINGFAPPNNSFTLCSGQNNATITLSGCDTYTWDSSPSQPTLNITPSVTSVYTVQGTNSCSTSISTLTINLIPQTLINAAIISNTNTVCYGQCQTFTASGASTYTWQNNITSSVNSICTLLTPTQTILLKFTDINGCKSTTATILNTYTVNLSVLGPDTVCSPNTPTLSALGANSYTWNIKVFPYSSTNYGANYTFTNFPNITSTANYNFTLTGIDVNNCKGVKTFTIPVYKPPTIQLNSVITKCPGAIDSLIVLNPSSSINTFTWNNSVIGNSIVITPTNTSSYTVETIYNQYGCVAKAVKIIYIYPLSLITFTPSTYQACEGGNPISFNINSPFPVKYLSNGFISNGFNPSVSGIFTISAFYIDTNQCVNKSAIQTITVLPAPVVSFSISQNILCQNSGSVLLQGQPNGGVFLGNNVLGNSYLTNTITSSSVIYKYTDINGCFNYDQKCISVVNCTSNNERNKLNEIIVFPNPFNSTLHIQNSSSTIKNGSIININGKVLFEFEINMNSTYHFENNLEKGIYILKIVGNNEVYSFKLIRI